MTATSGSLDGQKGRVYLIVLCNGYWGYEMKIHVSELEGLALDYAVAVTQGGGLASTRPFFKTYLTMPGCGYVLLDDYSPSTDWGQCGPLQDEFDLLVGSGPEFCWARINPAKEETPIGRGETRMVAICRAIVSAKLGEEVEIPDELVK